MRDDRDLLRGILPIELAQGGILMPAGHAVGVVVGGAVPWDLRPAEDHAALAQAYHQLLCNQEEPLDIYFVDQPAQVEDALTTLYARHQHVKHPTQAAVLEDLIARLSQAAQLQSSRAKLVVWTVTVQPGLAQRMSEGLIESLRGWWANGAQQTSAVNRQTLRIAVGKAKDLATRLAQLEGVPAPYLPNPEELARLLYQIYDPIRCQFTPFSGPLLERVRRVVTQGEQL